MVTQDQKLSQTEYKRQWRAANRDRVLAAKKRNYLKNKEAILLSQSERRKKEKEHLLSIERASRERRKEFQRSAKNARQSIRNRLTSRKKFLILDKELRRIYTSPCYKCGSTIRQSLDHIVPLSKGGVHSIGNIGTLCTPCNSSKGDKLLIEWKIFTDRKAGA